MSAFDNETDQALLSMLRENTGRQLCDSGSAYGRHWERNQELTLELAKARPHSSYTAYLTRDGKASFDITIDLFHWLRSRVNYEAGLDKLFNEFVAADETSDSYRQLVINWCKSLNGKYVNFIHGKIIDNEDEVDNSGWVIKAKPQGEDGPNLDVIYTYNHENYLSQDIQLTLFRLDTKRSHGWLYLALQVHNGCDAKLTNTLLDYGHSSASICNWK